MAIGDLYRFTVKSTVSGVECFNVDFKRLDTEPSNPLTTFELARDYHQAWQDKILPVLSLETTLNSVLCENLTDGVTFAEYAENVSGLAGGNAMPSFVSIGVRLNRSSKITRNGYKRIAGISENEVSNNDFVVAPAFQSEIEDMFSLSVEFDNVSNSPDPYLMETVIVGRTLNGSGVYELDLSKINPVLSAVLNPQVTSQVSRKED